MENQQTPSISLLWPAGFPAASRQVADLRNERGATDLGLDALASALSIDPYYTDGIKTILAMLCDQPQVIAYRHAVLDDLLNHPALAAGLAAGLPLLVQLGYASDRARAGETQLHQAVSRLGELELYVEAVKQFRRLLEDAGEALGSAALRNLRNLLIEREADPAFQSLAAELPALGAEIRAVRSVSIGINLDPELLPFEAALLGVSSQRYKGASASLLGKLLGIKPGEDAGDYQGIAPLHTTPLSSSLPAYAAGHGMYANPLLVPLFKDLNDVLEAVSKPVVKALNRYIKINGGFLIALQREIAFYLGGLRLIQRIRAAGLPICRPEVLPREQRACEVRDSYNLNFALRLLARQPGADLGSLIVTNDVNFGDDGRIFILTGPNQGGKTTYTQAAGLVQVLCQAGLYVPGSSARISPVDGIYTHFPVEERPSLEAGRLGEEAKRLAEIFTRATRYSLVLLNESLASTSPGEGLYLARDIVRALKLLGARAIFATHLHELAEGLDAFNAAWQGDSRLISLVAGTAGSSAGTVGGSAGAGLDSASGAEDSALRTYKILPGPALGLSYARDIATRYGISFEQLQQALNARTSA